MDYPLLTLLRFRSVIRLNVEWLGIKVEMLAENRSENLSGETRVFEVHVC
jgi:hypothetical protein